MRVDVAALASLWNAPVARGAHVGPHHHVAVAVGAPDRGVLALQLERGERRAGVEGGALPDRGRVATLAVHGAAARGRVLTGGHVCMGGGGGGGEMPEAPF